MSPKPGEPIRNPYDPSTWGSSCARGIKYKDLGPVVDGQKNAVRKISTGRKQRGSASDDLQRKEDRE